MSSILAHKPLKPVCPIVGLEAFSTHFPVSESLSAPILFASPHSGAAYPQTMLDDLCVPVMDLRRIEDAFIEQLYESVPEQGGHLVHANYARGYVDLNRDARELDPAMFKDGAPRTVAIPTPRVEAGLGCLPKVAAGGKLIYAKPISRADGEYRLAQVHDAYHRFLRTSLDRLKVEAGAAILIDCHSMPSQQPGQRKLPDIVLGDRFGSSCTSKLTSLAERTFRKLGYNTARNAPYAGGYTTRCYGRPRHGIHALQIEINRGLYMDEADITPTAGFKTVQNDLKTVIEALCAFARHRLV
ncbi:MAG: N-formylglutamate amidohydrolase [Hyphomonadaceae bacterium]